MVTLEAYDDFLGRILAEHGLDHGYNVWAEGPYHSHIIYKKDSLEKKSFLSRICGQHYSISPVAKFIEEPWFNAMQGCISDKSVQIGLIDGEYTEDIEQVMKEISNYSRLRKDKTNLVCEVQNPVKILAYR